MIVCVAAAGDVDEAVKSIVKDDSSGYGYQATMFDDDCIRDRDLCYVVGKRCL